MYQDYIETRKKLFRKFGIVSIAFIILGLFLIVWSVEIGVGAMIVGGGVLGFMTIQLSRSLHEFRSTLLVDLLRSKFDHVKYSRESGISRHSVTMSELLPKPDKYFSNDLIDAFYKGVHFKMSDILLQEVRHNGKNTQVVTIFKGPFLQVEFNKELRGKLIVQEAGKLTWFSKYKKIELESIDFNRTFQTYSTDEHTAFYVLTPHMMERMQRIEQEVRGRFYFSFINGIMYVALDNRSDNFEINMFGRIDESISARFEREMRLIMDLIDELKLNEKIFMKDLDDPI